MARFLGINFWGRISCSALKKNFFSFAPFFFLCRHSEMEQVVVIVSEKRKQQKRESKQKERARKKGEGKTQPCSICGDTEGNLLHSFSSLHEEQQQVLCQVTGVNLTSSSRVCPRHFQPHAKHNASKSDPLIVITEFATLAHVAPSKRRKIDRGKYQEAPTPIPEIVEKENCEEESGVVLGLEEEVTQEKEKLCEENVVLREENNALKALVKKEEKRVNKLEKEKEKMEKKLEQADKKLEELKREKVERENELKAWKVWKSKFHQAKRELVGEKAKLEGAKKSLVKKTEEVISLHLDMRHAKVEAKLKQLLLAYQWDRQVLNGGDHVVFWKKNSVFFLGFSLENVEILMQEWKKETQGREDRVCPRGMNIDSFFLLFLFWLRGGRFSFLFFSFLFFSFFSFLFFSFLFFSFLFFSFLFFSFLFFSFLFFSFLFFSFLFFTEYFSFLFSFFFLEVPPLSLFLVFLILMKGLFGATWLE